MEQIEISDRLKDHILDSIAEGVFTVDKHFRINFFNKAAEKITGFRREEVLGKFCKHVLKSDMCYIGCPISVVLKSKKNLYDFESNIQHTNGFAKPVKLNAAVLYNEEESPCGGIITLRDLTAMEALRKHFTEGTHFEGIIGHSKQMREIFELIKEISDSKAPVFIQGESGTGKEMVANAIQRTSSRNKEAYLKVNCSVFPDNLLASELFGHVKGAFTDAIKDRPGRFEVADGGTLFLDEIAEIPLQTQIQLLRVLQEGVFERVGESISRKSDVRVIAATNLDIEKALSSGKFREDLYYRLNVIPIVIPPLRERKTDIIPLTKHFLQKFALIYGKEIDDISDRAFDLLMSYSWPGNVRELENVIEFGFVRTKSGSMIEAEKLPAQVRNSKIFPARPAADPAPNIDEKNDLLSVLEKHKWNKSKTAKEMGIGRTTLWRLLKKHGISCMAMWSLLAEAPRFV